MANDKMSFKGSSNAQCLESQLLWDWNRDAFQRADFSLSWAPGSISAPSLSPIKRPANKDESGTKKLDQACSISKPPLGDVWSYIPDYVLKGWRSSQGIPGVRDQAFLLHRISLTCKKHFVLVDTSKTSPIVQWQGPNIMSVSTRITYVFKYIKEELDVYWTEWVDFHITGYSQYHFPPRPVWRRIKSFHVHINSHLSDFDGLSALREEVFCPNGIFDAPYLQVVIRIRPPRLKWLAQVHPEKRR